MLLAIDDQFGEDAHLHAIGLRRAFGHDLVPFVAPRDEPDDGALAALSASRAAVLGPPERTPWLERLEGVKVVCRTGDDVVQVVGRALGLRPGAPATAKPLRVTPLDASSLRSGLQSLGEAWRIEVGTDSGLGGLKVELVASFRRDSYAAAADFAHALAVLAEAQNHHPTLIHDWRSVTVRVATGEAGQRLTDRDLRFAAAADRLASG